MRSCQFPGDRARALAVSHVITQVPPTGVRGARSPVSHEIVVEIESECSPFLLNSQPGS